VRAVERQLAGGWAAKSFMPIEFRGGAVYRSFAISPATY
jgi:hypothetical protein